MNKPKTFTSRVTIPKDEFYDPAHGRVIEYVRRQIASDLSELIVKDIDQFEIVQETDHFERLVSYTMRITIVDADYLIFLQEMAKLASTLLDRAEKEVI